MGAEQASEVQPLLRVGEGCHLEDGLFGSPSPRSSCPSCLSFVAVLRFSVGVTVWNSTESFEGNGTEGEERKGGRKN